MTEEKKKENKEIQLGESKIASKVLVEPWITECSTQGLERNEYTFKVTKEANKHGVKKAIQELYKVKVLSVNTITMKRKFVSYGRTPGWRTGFKKAIVKLKEGDSIELMKKAD